MTDSDALERTLATARAALVAPAAARVRLRAGLQASGAFGATKAPSPAAIARVGVAPGTVSVLVALGFAAGYWLGHAPAPGPLASPTPAVTAPSAAPPSLVPVTDTPPAPPPDPQGVRSADETPAAERAHTARPRSPAARRPAPPSEPNAFAQELALLQRAERALRAGEAELTLSLVGELERRYPASTLSEERAAVRIMAECTADLPDARTRAERFLRDRLASVYTDRVGRVCELGTAVPRAGSDGSRSRGH